MFHQLPEFAAALFARVKMIAADQLHSDLSTPVVTIEGDPESDDPLTPAPQAVEAPAGPPRLP